MHPLRQQIARLRRHIRRLMLAYAIGWVAISLLGAVLAVGLADYLIRFQDRGMRIIASVTVFGMAAWAVYRYLWPVLWVRLSDVAIARRVERRFPELADRLSSAIDFLDQPEDEPTAGSADLRRAVITHTAADVENLRWSAAVDARPAARVGVMALTLALIALAVLLLNPRASVVALERLAMPWHDIAWPRNHHLAFKNTVTRVAVGQDFEVELIDEGGLPPEDARIVYRYGADSDAVEEQQERPVKLGGALVARRENVTRPFEYRAVGGDDDTMPWIGVEVVEPPSVESLAITLHPPRYTGWPATPSERRIEALRGTRVALVGKTTRPITTAAVRQENGPNVSLRITDEGRGFVLDAPTENDAASPSAGESSGDSSIASTWLIDKSGKYWIELHGDDLIGGGDDRWDVRAIADEPPRITLERPIGTLFVTAAAVVPIKLDVRDDLAIRQVALHYLRSDRSDAGEQMLELYVGPQAVAIAQTAKNIAHEQHGEAQIIEHDFDLAPLGLAPGVQLTMTASADDYRPQTGVSQAVRIVVLTPAEFEDRIAARQSGILAEIARVLKMQQETRAGAHALQTQIERVGEFRKQDADSAHTAELSQRQIRRSLASSSEGVLAQTTALLDELAANRLDSPELIRRVERIQSEIRRLNAEELATIEQELVALVKNSQLALDESPAGTKEIIARIAASLTTAVAAQDGVIAALEKLLDDLAEWNDYRAISRDIAEVQRDERTLQKQTQSTEPATLGRDFKDLTVQQQADLQNLGSAQAQLARRFDKLQQRMERMNAKIRETAPLAAASLTDAIELVRRQGIGSDMRDSARFLEGNRLGQAIGHQQTIDSKLQELLDILSNRREQELSRLVKRLRAAEEKLSGLRQQQQGLRKKIREAHDRLQAANTPGVMENERNELARLMREERKLQDEVERFARELERLRAEDAASKLAGAGGKMQRGAEAAEQGESGKAADLADEAKKDLDEAQRQLAERRRQAEQDLANEQLATVEHALAGLAGRQEGALVETKRLNDLRDSEGRLQPEQSDSLKDLAHNQTQLKVEADAVAEKVNAAEVFQLGVQSAANQMHRAAELLGHDDTGEPAQRAEAQALARLRQLLAAIKEGQSAAGEPKPGEGQNPDNGGAKDNRPKPIVHSVTEIKLLTVMQEDVNRRTIELQKQIDGRAPTELEKRDLSLLAEEQGRIAALAARLTARAADQSNSDDDAEKDASDK